jgi:hypothetical protein
MFKAVKEVVRQKLGFYIDGGFLEIRMDDIRKAVRAGSISNEDFDVIQEMFPEPVKLPNYNVTTQAIICAFSKSTQRQLSHMDSEAPDLILQNVIYKFPISSCGMENQDSVLATVFKDVYISNHLDLSTCDGSEIQQLFQVDWEKLPEVGLKYVRSGDTVEFNGHVVHYGPGPDETSEEFWRVVAFQVNQPVGKKEEHPPEQEYQVRQYYPHYLKHPNLFFKSLSKEHRFWNDFCNHTPYAIIQAALKLNGGRKAGKVKRATHVTPRQLEAYLIAQQKRNSSIENVTCEMCGRGE